MATRTMQHRRIWLVKATGSAPLVEQQAVLHEHLVRQHSSIQDSLTMVSKPAAITTVPAHLEHQRTWAPTGIFANARFRSLLRTRQSSASASCSPATQAEAACSSPLPRAQCGEERRSLSQPNPMQATNSPPRLSLASVTGFQTGRSPSAPSCRLTRASLHSSPALTEMLKHRAGASTVREAV